MFKSINILVGALLMAGCAESISTGGKSQFYEYDGGMINLTEVAQITTAATLTLSVLPRKDNGAYDTEARAIYEAHTQFCNESIPSREFRGNIDQAQAALNSMVITLDSRISSEILDTCAITITSSAVIKFDEFAVVLPSGSFTLPYAPKDVGSGLALQRYVSSSISSNVTQPAEWQREYDYIRTRT
jgi:hypothetical protein